MAMDAWADMEEVLMRALESESSPVRRLLAFSIMGHRYNVRQSIRFEANQLAAVPSIWQRASLARHQQVPEACEAFESRLNPVIRTAIETAGTLRASETVMLRPELGGRVERILFEDGQQVTAGSEILSLDTAILKAELADAEARKLLASSEFK